MNICRLFQKIFGHSFQAEEFGHRLERKHNKNFARIVEVTEGFLVFYNRHTVRNCLGFETELFFEMFLWI